MLCCIVQVALTLSVQRLSSNNIRTETGLSFILVLCVVLYRHSFTFLCVVLNEPILALYSASEIPILVYRTDRQLSPVTNVAMPPLFRTAGRCYCECTGARPGEKKQDEVKRLYTATRQPSTYPLFSVMEWHVLLVFPDQQKLAVRC